MKKQGRCIVCISLLYFIVISYSYTCNFTENHINFSSEICYPLFKSDISDAALAVVSTCRYATTESGINRAGLSGDGVLRHAIPGSYCPILKIERGRMDSVDNQPQSLLFQKEQETGISYPSNPYKKWYIVFFIAATLLIMSGTVIWVLNIVGIISGPWSSIFNAIFAGVSIIIALLSSLIALICAAKERK